MRNRDSIVRSGLATWTVALSFAGCMVVAPIEDLPEPLTTSGGAGSGGRNGTSGRGSGGAGSGGTEGAAAGQAAEAGKAGSGGSGGSAASGGVSGTGAGLAGTGGSATPGGEGGGGGEPQCTTNADCVELAGGDPYRCLPSEGRCVQLRSNECPLVHGDFEDPNAIYFGAFATLVPEQPQVNSVAWAAELAVDDLNDEGGLPGGPGGARRPLVMITCTNDDVDGPALIDAGLGHLVDDVQVTSMLATLKPGDLLRAVERYKQRKLFYLSPVSLTTDLTDPNYRDNGLIWNLLGEPLDFAVAYEKLLYLVEAQVRRDRNLTDEPLKVALVTSDDVFNDELSNFVFPRLRWNNQDSGVNNQQGLYLSEVIPLDQPDLVAVRQRILDFAPDIIISTASEVVTQRSGVLERVETGWDGPGDRGARPYWILSPYNAGDLRVVEEWIEEASTGKIIIDEYAAGRFLGISAASAVDSTLRNDFVTRLTDAHEDAITDTGNYYDAVYFLAYALYASGNPGIPSGPETAAGMLRLIEGEPKDGSPDQIDEIFELLAAPEETLSLNTTLGAPDFDPATGVRRATPSVFCFQKLQELILPRSDVLRFDREDETFTGSYPCLDGFFEP